MPVWRGIARRRVRGLVVSGLVTHCIAVLVISRPFSVEQFIDC
jgi:hypothetical protein